MHAGSGRSIDRDGERRWAAAWDEAGATLCIGMMTTQVFRRDERNTSEIPSLELFVCVYYIVHHYAVRSRFLCKSGCQCTSGTIINGPILASIQCSLASCCLRRCLARRQGPSNLLLRSTLGHAPIARERLERLRAPPLVGRSPLPRAAWHRGSKQTPRRLT